MKKEIKKKEIKNKCEKCNCNENCGKNCKCENKKQNKNYFEYFIKKLEILKDFVAFNIEESTTFKFSYLKIKKYNGPEDFKGVRIIEKSDEEDITLKFFSKSISRPKIKTEILDREYKENGVTLLEDNLMNDISYKIIKNVFDLIIEIANKNNIIFKSNKFINYIRSIIIKHFNKNFIVKYKIKNINHLVNKILFIKYLNSFENRYGCLKHYIICSEEIGKYLSKHIDFIPNKNKEKHIILNKIGSIQDVKIYTSILYNGDISSIIIGKTLDENLPNIYLHLLNKVEFERKDDKIYLDVKYEITNNSLKNSISTLNIKLPNNFLNEK